MEIENLVPGNFKYCNYIFFRNVCIFLYDDKVINTTNKIIYNFISIISHQNKNKIRFL